jgi:hypothetical protein
MGQLSTTDAGSQLGEGTYNAQPPASGPGTQRKGLGSQARSTASRAWQGTKSGVRGMTRVVGRGTRKIGSAVSAGLNKARTALTRKNRGGLDGEGDTEPGTGIGETGADAGETGADAGPSQQGQVSPQPALDSQAITQGISPQVLFSGLMTQAGVDPTGTMSQTVAAT